MTCGNRSKDVLTLTSIFICRGPGTPFKDFEYFVESMKKRGLGFLEMLAMEMKASGESHLLLIEVVRILPYLVRKGRQRPFCDNLNIFESVVCPETLPCDVPSVSKCLRFGCSADLSVDTSVGTSIRRAWQWPW